MPTLQVQLARQQPKSVEATIVNGNSGLRAVVNAAITACVIGALLPWAEKVSLDFAIMCLAQIAICTSAAIRCAYPVLRPIGLVIFIFTGSWLSVASLYQLSHHLAAWGDSSGIGRPGTGTALLLDLTAVGALYLGYFLYPSPPPSCRNLKREDDGVYLPRRLVPGPCLVLCLLLLPNAVASAGGFLGMFSSRTAATAALSASGISLQQSGGAAIAAVRTLPTALAVVSAYLFLCRVLHQRKSRREGGAVLAFDVGCLVLSGALTLFLANPFINPRQVTAAALGSLALLLFRPRRRLGGVLTGLITVFATLVAYPVANAFRGNDSRTSLGMGVLATNDFDGFQQVINTVQYVNDLGHDMGMHILSGLLFPIPRSIWHGKSHPASIDVAQHRGYWFTDLSLPFPAELYLGFGIFGMAAILGLLAYLFAHCDRAWRERPASAAALFVPYASVATLLLMRGPLGSTGPFYLPVLGLLALAVVHTKLSTKRVERVTDPEPVTTSSV